MKFYEGFDNISFGMNPDEIRTALKRKPKKFYKVVGDAYASDDYGDFLYAIMNIISHNNIARHLCL